MPEIPKSFTAHVRRVCLFQERQAWHGDAKHRDWAGTEPLRVWGSTHPASSHLSVDLALLQAGDAVPVQRARLIKFPERPGVGSKAWFPGCGRTTGGTPACQRRGCPRPGQALLASVGEEAGLVRLDDDHVKELAPVGTHHVPHPLVPGRRGAEWDRRQREAPGLCHPT